MSLRVIGSAWAIGPVSISLIKLLHGFESSVPLVAALKYITANFNPLLSATVYLIGFHRKALALFFSRPVSAICTRAWALPVAISYSAVSPLCFTPISFITLDKARVFSSQPVPAN